MKNVLRTEYNAADYDVKSQYVRKLTAERKTHTGLRIVYDKGKEFLTVFVIVCGIL